MSDSKSYKLEISKKMLLTVGINFIIFLQKLDHKCNSFQHNPIQDCPKIRQINWAFKRPGIVLSFLCKPFYEIHLPQLRNIGGFIYRGQCARTEDRPYP